MPLLISCFFAGLAFHFLRIPYWKKKPLIRWILILLPPSFLLPLAIIPIRNPLAMITWMPVFVFLIGTIIIFLYVILKFLLKPSDKALRLKLIRPALTIAVFIFVFSFHKISKNMAIANAINVAKEMQNTCDSTGLCPASIKNWYKKEGAFGDPNSFSNDFYKLEIPYHITYRPSKDRKDFTVNLYVGFNMGVWVKGGVGKKLNAVYAVEGTEQNIPIE